MKRAAVFILILSAALLFAGCATTGVQRGPPPTANDRRWVSITMVVTGYCPCEQCCNWRRTWYGRPVIARGPNAGKPKVIGITACGRRARPGTIAADTAVLPMGTTIYVPGYGYGEVEDAGGAIRGRRLDLFFHTHAEALRWGVKRLTVRAQKKNR